MEWDWWMCQKKLALKHVGFVLFFCVEMIQSVFSWVEIGRFLTVTLIPRVCSIHMMYERVIFQAISAAAKHSSVKEINDRKGYLAFKHRHGEQMHKVFDPLRGGTTWKLDFLVVLLSFLNEPEDFLCDLFSLAIFAKTTKMPFAVFFLPPKSLIKIARVWRFELQLRALYPDLYVAWQPWSPFATWTRHGCATDPSCCLRPVWWRWCEVLMKRNGRG